MLLLLLCFYYQHWYALRKNRSSPGCSIWQVKGTRTDINPPHRCLNIHGLSCSNHHSICSHCLNAVQRHICCIMSCEISDGNKTIMAVADGLMFICHRNFCKHLVIRHKSASYQFISPHSCLRCSNHIFILDLIFEQRLANETSSTSAVLGL